MKKLLLFILFAASVQFAAAQRGDIRFTGWNEFLLDFASKSGNIKVGRIDNYRNGGKSGTLYIQVWLFSSPYNGTVQNGYKLGDVSLGQLSGGYYFHSMNYPISWQTEPPVGTYYVSFLLVEYNPLPGGNYWVSDWLNFDQRATVTQRVEVEEEEEEEEEEPVDYGAELKQVLKDAQNQTHRKTVGEKVYVVSQDLSGKFRVVTKEGDSTHTVAREYSSIPWSSLASVSRYGNTRSNSALEALVLYFNVPVSYSTYVNDSYSSQRSGRSKYITLYVRKDDLFDAEDLIYGISGLD